MTVCIESGCAKAVHGRGLCSMHLSRLQRTGSTALQGRRAPVPVGQGCSVAGCERGGRITAGYCQSHYARLLRYGDPQAGAEFRRRGKGSACSVAECERGAWAHGLCGKHYQRLATHGDPSYERPEGTIDGSGYRIITRHGHPNAGRNGQVAEHTVVMAEILGRPLRAGENVHHKNGLRSDNAPENLELWTVKQPPGRRVSEQIAWAVNFLSEYAGDLSVWPDESPAILAQAALYIEKWAAAPVGLSGAPVRRTR